MRVHLTTCQTKLNLILFWTSFDRQHLMPPGLAAFKWERPAFQYSPERWHPVRAIGTENEVSKDSVSDDVVEEVASKEKISDHQLMWHNDHLEVLTADKEGTFYL